MKSSEIRRKFLDFFEAKEHKVLPGASLIPKDPTVLLTLAGMLQFKPIFLGLEKPEFHKVATVQRCIRMNDLENVGKTARHHTFFEMLGNFSFGNYFKKEAIQYAWEFLTKELGLSVQKLKIAVYEKDDEAFELWNKDIGLPKDIIYRLGEDNNFWAVGPTGPCGPCSEIYYDLGAEEGCGKIDCSPGCDCDRFLEIWNLVFIQYNRDEKGELVPLKQKGIDTGMGIERIASVLQGSKSNFETDLFAPLIEKIRAIATAPQVSLISAKIIADHIRAVTHLIADGVFPGNTGRGYVLRRLIRRAVSHGRKLGINPPFLASLGNEVITQMKDAYPVLREKSKTIAEIIWEEEKSFFLTLDNGFIHLENLVRLHEKDKLIRGEEAFKLHDTFGFPIELAAELFSERGCGVDMAGFEKEMELQRERARKNSQESDKKKLTLGMDFRALKPTVFTGYERSAEESKVIMIIPERKLVILEKSPFYGESGGQVGDSGILFWENREIRVMTAFITPQGVVLHEVDRLEGLKEGIKVKALIDSSKRKSTEAHHTSTHLLHKALREILGGQVRQAGSYVGPDKLRFDFSHFHALTPEEIQKVEAAVNQKIKEKIKVEVLNKSFDEAIKMGATALFGEKYGKKVRVIKIGDYCVELCGGTHVKNTADIAFFKIVSEESLGAGFRRIEAVAAQAAKVNVIFRAKSLYDEVHGLIKRYRLLEAQKRGLCGEESLEPNIFEIEATEIDRISKAVDDKDSANVNKYLDHLCGRFDWLKERIAKTEKEIDHLKLKNAKNEADAFLSEAREIGGKKILLKEVKGCSMDILREINDLVQSKAGPVIVVLASSFSERISFLVSVSKEIISGNINAKKIAEVFAGVVGGRGGGKDTKVEGGGKNPSKVKEAFLAVEAFLK